MNKKKQQTNKYTIQKLQVLEPFSVLFCEALSQTSIHDITILQLKYSYSHG